MVSCVTYSTSFTIFICQSVPASTHIILVTILITVDVIAIIFVVIAAIIVISSFKLTSTRKFASSVVLGHLISRDSSLFTTLCLYLYLFTTLCICICICSTLSVCICICSLLSLSICIWISLWSCLCICSPPSVFTCIACTFLYFHCLVSYICKHSLTQSKQSSPKSKRRPAIQKLNGNAYHIILKVPGIVVLNLKLSLYLLTTLCLYLYLYSYLKKTLTTSPWYSCIALETAAVSFSRARAFRVLHFAFT